MEKRARKIVIIGAGPAGMCAGIFAARAGADVLIIEHGTEPGKKILSTGGGRCNLTNVRMGTEYYPGADADFTEAALSAFGPSETAAFFDSIGLFTADRGGYVYPRSMNAASVRTLLVSACAAEGAEIRTGMRAERIERRNGKIIVSTVSEAEAGTVSCDRLIFACGGTAAPASGSDGSGFALLDSLGIPVTEPLPALVPLKGDAKRFRALAGIRTHAKASLFLDGRYTASDTGEVQFTQDTVSGIPVFNISGTAVRALKDGRRVSVVFDLLPELREKELMKAIFSRSVNMTLFTALNGLLPGKVCSHFLRLAGLQDLAERDIADAGEDRVRELIRLLKDFSVEIRGDAGCERAQTSTGGVRTENIDPRTMQVRKVPGVFIAGEMIDVTGICGGYNLQWAWTSGALAGKAAAL